MKMYGWDHDVYCILKKKSWSQRYIFIKILQFSRIFQNFPEISKSGWFLMKNAVKVMTPTVLFHKKCFRIFQRFSEFSRNFKKFAKCKTNFSWKVTFYILQKKNQNFQKLLNLWMTPYTFLILFFCFFFYHKFCKKTKM